jgi:hypothetical protein
MTPTGTPPVRLLAVALLALAAFVYFGLAVPWRDEASTLADETLRLQAEQRALTRRLMEAEKTAALRAKASVLARPAAGAVTSDAEVQRVRTSVVRALDPVRSSQLEVRSAPAPLAASVALSTEGDFFTVVKLVSALGPSGSGLVIERLTLSPSGPAASLHVDAVALGGTP